MDRRLAILPLIEIIDSHCSTCICGEDGTETYYRKLLDNPREFCSLLRNENAKSIFIKDCNSFYKNEIVDINLLKDISESVKVPIWFFAEFRDSETVLKYIDEINPIRIVIDSKNMENEFVNELLSQINATDICVFSEIRDEGIFYKDSNLELYDFSKLLITKGFDRLILKNSANKPDIYENMALIYKELKLKFAIYDGINNYQQLIEIEKYKYSGIDTVIIGKALYENHFPCQQIWRIAELNRITI